MSIQFLRGSHHLPSQLPGEHTVVLSHMAHSTCQAICHYDQSQPYIGRVRRPVVGHESDGPQVVFNVHQSHRHHSTHPSLFLLSWVPLVYMWSAAQLGLVSITLWSNASRMVTHPCINWARDYLTSVIKHKTFAPCYVSSHIV